MVRLGDVCKVVSGSTPKTNVEKYWGGQLKWITPAELDSDTYIVCDSQRHITEIAVIDTGLKSFPKGTVILSSRAPIGKVAIADTEMYCNQGFKNLICSDKINNRYLYQFLSSKTDYLNSLGRGATFKELSKSILENVEIELPDLDTQEKIANIFEEVNVVIAKRKKQLPKLDELVKARFVEMFGEPDTNVFNWETTTLSKHLDVIGGYAFKSDMFRESGVPVLRIGNINTGRFLPINLVFWENDVALNKYKILPGDLVMSLTGTVGKDDYGNVCVLDASYQEYYLNQRNAKLVLKETLNKYYLCELLKFEQIKKKLTGISRGVRQANISNKDILELQVYLPPIELQNQFAEFIQKIDKSKLEVQKSLDKLETLKKALMQKYFG